MSILITCFISHRAIRKTISRESDWYKYTKSMWSCKIKMLAFYHICIIFYVHAKYFHRSNVKNSYITNDDEQMTTSALTFEFRFSISADCEPSGSKRTRARSSSSRRGAAVAVKVKFVNGTSGTTRAANRSEGKGCCRIGGPAYIRIAAASPASALSRGDHSVIATASAAWKSTQKRRVAVKHNGELCLQTQTPR